MRRFITCVVCCICWMVIGSAGAHGADVVDTVITQLTAGARVYVEPGTEGTSSDTTAVLKQALTENDHLVLVILPADSSPTESIDQVVRRIDAATGYQFTIGVIRGVNAIGYSTVLPDGVASDAMNRAKSIAPNQTEALLTYVRVIHDWQTAHPLPTASPSSDGNTQTGVDLWKPTIGGVIGAAIGVVAFRLIRRRNAGFRAQGMAAGFEASPPTIRKQLQELLILGERVTDDSLRKEITSIAENINDFFGLSHDSNRETSDDAKVYAGHLDTILTVLRGYMAIQGKPHLFKNAAKQMTEASADIKQFGGFVLSSIQDSNDFDLRSFKTSVATLKAFGEIADLHNL